MYSTALLPRLASVQSQRPANLVPWQLHPLAIVQSPFMIPADGKLGANLTLSAANVSLSGRTPTPIRLGLRQAVAQWTPQGLLG